MLHKYLMAQFRRVSSARSAQMWFPMTCYLSSARWMKVVGFSPGYDYVNIHKQWHLVLCESGWNLGTDTNSAYMAELLFSYSVKQAAMIPYCFDFLKSCFKIWSKGNCTKSGDVLSDIYIHMCVNNLILSLNLKQTNFYNNKNNFLIQKTQKKILKAYFSFRVRGCPTSGYKSVCLCRFVEKHR